MNFLFDVIIIGIIIFAIYRGVSQGFVKSALRLLSIVVAFFAAYYFTDALAEIYNDKFLFEFLSGEVSDVITPMINRVGDIFDVKTLFNDPPDIFLDLLNRFGADAKALEEAYASSASAGAQVIEGLSQAIAEPISALFSRVLAFLTIFVGAVVVFLIVIRVSDMIFKIPALEKANKVLGCLFGVVSALVSAYLFSEVSVGLINVGIALAPELFSENIIDNSILLKFFSGLSIFSIL